MSESEGIVAEFLLESFEGLEQVDRDLVALEERPGDRELLDRVFRVVHTIKGTCSFLGFPDLERLSHAGEHLLSRLRDGALTLTPPVAGVLLKLVDDLRRLLTTIQATGAEGGVDTDALEARLVALAEQAGAASPAAAAGEEVAPAWAVAAGAASASESAVRVDVRVLDRLMDLVGELVLTRNQLLRLADGASGDGLGSPLQHLNLVTSELQEGIMKTRMQPVGRIWGKFPRLVRDLATSCGKKVRLEMEGQETELDRSLIEAIRDPLTHLVRNAVDHGIESPEVRVAAGKAEVGTLRLMAYHEGGQVNIEIADDGAGIDAERVRRAAVARGIVSEEQAARLTQQEAVNLIFVPGFSTAREVTNVSGRGVGMDVVKTNLERVNGLIDVTSRPGRGTTIKLKIPLTLAIVPALIVVTAGQRFAIPQASILELVRLGGEEGTVEEVHGAPVYRLRGHLLPLVDLGRELQTGGILGRAGGVTLAVLQADERQFGLVVDAVEDSQEIVVKPLGRLLERIPVYAGATIMGDGRVALILDVLGLAQRAHVVSEVRERGLLESVPRAVVQEEGSEALLLFRSPDDGRMAIPLAEVMRLEQLPADSVEWVGGSGVVQYRGDILPLVQVFAHLPERRQQPRAAEPNPEVVDVVVYRHEGRDVGLVVGTILDIVDEVIEVRRPSSREGVRECAVIRGRVAELLDVGWIIRTAAPPFLERRVEA